MVKGEGPALRGERGRVGEGGVHRGDGGMCMVCASREDRSTSLPMELRALRIDSEIHCTSTDQNSTQN